jgi:methyl coenzyme M reductase alpha subunit
LANSAAQSKRPPTTGAALVEQARVKNRWMAIGLASFFVTAFILVMVATVVNNRYYAAHHPSAVKHAALTHATAR